MDRGSRQEWSSSQLVTTKVVTTKVVTTELVTTEVVTTERWCGSGGMDITTATRTHENYLPLNV